MTNPKPFALCTTLGKIDAPRSDGVWRDDPLSRVVYDRAKAQLLAAEGDIDGAIFAYRRALGAPACADITARADIHVSLGSLYARRGETNEALAEFGRALGLRPRYVPALEAIVSLHAAACEWRELSAAEDRLFLALPEGPRFERLLSAASRWEEIARIPVRARALLERALRLRPGDENASTRLSDLECGGRTRGLVAKARSIVCAVVRRYATAEMAARRGGKAPVLIRVATSTSY